MKKCLVLSLAIIFFISCKISEEEPADSIDFYFDSPQPINDSELNRFPSKFMGMYISSTQDTLFISDKAIYYSFMHKSTFSKTEFDSLKKGANYKDGKLSLKDFPTVFNVVEKDTMVYLSNIRRDTVFILNEMEKAKRINGYLVLSKKDSIFWKTSILSIKNDSLSWRNISSPKDYITLMPIVKKMSRNADTTIIHLQPTRKEFRKILELKELGWQKIYRKMK